MKLGPLQSVSSTERQFLAALSTADVHINAGRLLAPAEGNAYSVLMELQSDHQGDSRLQASTERLGERLLAGAAAASVADRISEATDYLDAAEVLGVLAPQIRTARLSLQRALERPTEAAEAVVAADEPQEVPIRSLTDLEIQKFVSPRYPRSARRRELVGFVDVEFRVNEDGSTGEIESVRSEPGDVFISSAKNAVRQWQFAPREKTVLAQVTLRFELDR